MNPASFAQERLFFVNELDPGNPGYVIAFALRLRGELDVAALRGALTDLVARHDALRTGFEVRAGGLVQHIADGHTVDVVSGSCADRDIRALVAEQASRPFDLTGGAVFRATIVVGERETVLVVLVHHIACDGWSVGILLDDLAALYDIRVGARDEPLPEPVSYVDHTIRERSDWQRHGQQALAYWRENLDGVRPLAMPTDRSRPAVLSHRGAVIRRPLPDGLPGSLTTWARSNGSTLSAVVMAAYAKVLAAYSRQDDVVIGVPVANRPDDRSEAVVGCLVDMLPLRVGLTADQSFVDLVRQVRDTMLSGFAHEEAPFEEIVRALAPDRQLSHAPLVQTTCTVQNFPFELPALAGVEVTEVEVEIDAVKFDLGLTLDVSAARPFLRLEYSTDLFRPESMSLLLDHVLSLLGSVGGLEPSMVDSAESRLVTEMFNPGLAPGSIDTPLARFVQHARSRPDAPAVVHNGRTRSYRELDEWSDRIAGGLRGHGVRRGDLVGLLLGRSPAVIAAIIAVWKLGAAYVPLDPGYPHQRLALISEDSGVSVLLVEDGTAALAAAIAPTATALDVHGLDGEADPVAVTSGDLAYVIYTSGSTGRPKGVLVGHRGVTELFAVEPGGLRVDADDVWLCAHSFSFDFSVWEVWGALAYGGTVVVADELEVRDPDRLATLIDRAGVTVLSQTPGSLYRLLGPLAVAPRYLVTGGEALDWVRLADLLADVDWPETRIVNMYGITEGTVHVTAVSTPVADLPLMRPGDIGRPLPSGRCYVLDDRRRPTGVDVPGELYIGGALVAGGYLGNAELTDRRFVPDPFHGNGSARMYRTGDIAKWTPDGSLVYLGREDGQVQVRGHRVELDEVQRAFLASPEVQACAVVADGDGLAAFVRGGDERDLRDQVRAILPAYMVPSRIVMIDSVPLTAHGKVDTAALLALRPTPAVRTTTAGPVEERIRLLWAEVLGRADVGPTDNFFDLGGHSYALITLQQRLSDAGFDLTVTDLFQFGTVRACAAHVTATAAGHNGRDSAELSTRRRAALRGAAIRSARAKGVRP